MVGEKKDPAGEVRKGKKGYKVEIWGVLGGPGGADQPEANDRGGWKGTEMSG